MICPVCGEELCRTDRSLKCSRSHSFDIAAEGYVNLLPPRHGTRGIVGDTREMLQARRRFLDAGFYRPLAETLAEAVAEHLTGNPLETANIAEAGCGEGYYIGFLQRSLLSRYEVSLSFYGMDLSRDAVRLAARRYSEISFHVGDIWDKMLFADASLDILLDIFAPRNPAEFGRVLKADGLLLIVLPGPEHMVELRREFQLLEQEPDKEEQVEGRFRENFIMIKRRTLDYDMELDGTMLADLVWMTPNARHMEETRMDELRARSRRVRASFVILELQRRAER